MATTKAYEFVYEVCSICGREEPVQVETGLFQSLVGSALEAAYNGKRAQYQVVDSHLEKSVTCEECLAQDNTWDSYLSSDHFRMTCGLAAASEQ
jgi:hypothetical protein